MTTPRLSVCLAVLVAGLAFGPAHASTVNFELDVLIDGSAPEGPLPWVTASLEDVTGGVRLDVDGTNLADAEFLRSLFLNVDNTIDPTSLTITSLSGVAPESVDLGADSFSVPSGGDFDVKIDFPSAPGPSLGAGDTASLLIEGPVLATSFNFGSQAPSPAESFAIAALVKGISEVDEEDGFIGDGHGDEVNGEVPPPPVPEPAIGLLLTAGLVGLGALRNRKS